MQSIVRLKPSSPTRLLAMGPLRVPTARARGSIICPQSHPRAIVLPYSTVTYHSQKPPKDYKLDASQVFGSEVKVNPSESEADVAADRGEIDPLPMGKHNTILVDAGEASVYSKPTDSEEAVHADREKDDPLRGKAGDNR
ncbi:hypothetical protein NKR19_g10243 [Coniochaeta hoffmannii]|uniref:Uncharacterized protein n=1 Tax=Coniochaeta hoffmannii TaxID=91930 RepID=A0AA38VFU9_9PEZI|nr:hypothetical protein NKR19_g10243 [Coniochaeta hoffmannii]